MFNARPALGTRDAVWTNRDALKSLWAAVATASGHAFPKANAGAPVHWVAKPCAPDFAPLAWLAFLVRLAALVRCWSTDPKVTFITRGEEAAARPVGQAIVRLRAVDRLAHKPGRAILILVALLLLVRDTLAKALALPRVARWHT